jgi:hypothetical protein
MMIDIISADNRFKSVCLGGADMIHKAIIEQLNNNTSIQYKYFMLMGYVTLSRSPLTITPNSTAKPVVTNNMWYNLTHYHS